jgi:hypothetical protein
MQRDKKAIQHVPNLRENFKNILLSRSLICLFLPFPIHLTLRVFAVAALPSSFKHSKTCVPLIAVDLIQRQILSTAFLASVRLSQFRLLPG